MTGQPELEPHLTELDDDRLAELSREWRARALRGEQSAFGPAQALEAELRRRVRNTDLAPLSDLPEAPPKPWWKVS